MARLIVSLVVLVAVVLGAVFLLGRLQSERPTTRVEKAVDVGALAK